MTQHMDNAEIERQAAELLRRYLGETDLQSAAEEHGVDLAARLPEGSLAVGIKSTRRRSVEDMQGRLATAVLQMRRYAGPYEHRIILLHAPRIGSRAVAKLETFMQEYAPDIGWGAWDERGGVHLRLPQLDIVIDSEARNSREQARDTTHNKRAFTDLNRWLLKVLMLRDAPNGMWHRAEPYRRAVANPAELQRVSHVSQAKAYQFARTFRDLGFLRWDRSNFELVERRKLYELWHEEERQLRAERYPVRSIFRAGEGVDDIFASVGTEVQYAVGGFEACRLHGVLHTKRRTPEIHIFQNPNYVIQRLDLELCETHEADMYLVEMPYRESIQRGTLHVGDVRVVDILQAALDAGRHPQRGREQAEYIVQEVLGWK